MLCGISKTETLKRTMGLFKNMSRTRHTERFYSSVIGIVTWWSSCNVKQSYVPFTKAKMKSQSFPSAPIQFKTSTGLGQFNRNSSTCFLLAINYFQCLVKCSNAPQIPLMFPKQQSLISFMGPEQMRFLLPSFVIGV